MNRSANVFWRRLLGCAIVIGAVLVAEVQGQDWPALRGENGTGVVHPKGILAQTPDIDLKVRWKKKIGSGYSSVVIERGRLIAMYTLGADDVIECFNGQDGQSIWRERIDAKFPGENGSFDGPLATPVIHQGKVFGLTPRGKLFSRSLADGSEIWSRDLVAEEKTVKPLYGFATSPMIAAGKLIVQVGGKDKALAAFDLDNGKTLWTVGNDEISAQSPGRLLVEGKEVILAGGGKKLMGVDPINGKILFEFEHGGKNGSAMVPVALDNSHVLLTLDDNFSKAVLLTPSGEQITASDAWTERSIKNSYNVPALVNNFAFAYSTRFLTCVDPETGIARWKDRKPGDGFLIAVDGKLIISTKTGSLHVAEASADGFRELAQLAVFDDLVWSIPAYGDNAIYQRSLGEVACVDIIPRSAGIIADANAHSVVGPKFEALLETVKSATDAPSKQKIVDEFISAQSTFPIIEGDVVHFVYRGSATDVAVAGDMFGSRQERAMLRVPETDLFYYAMELPDDQRSNYIFLVNYQPQIDSLNPRRVLSSLYAGEMEFAIRLQPDQPLEMNWFAMSDWKAPAWQSKLTASAKATLIAEKLESKISKAGVAFDVYLPPNYSHKPPEKRYPVVYVMDGPGAKQFGHLPEIVDLLFADHGQIAPILVLVDAMAAGEFGGEQFAELLAKEVVPFIDSKYPSIADRQSRSLLGVGFTSEAALIALGKHPDLFSAASAQSPLLFTDASAAAIRLISEIKLPSRVYMEWGRFDMFNPHENWDLRTMSQKLFDGFQGNPQVQVTGGMVNDSTDWSSWQNRLEPIMKFLVEH